MTKEAYNVIGVMSGTSLDGIDLVYVSLFPSDWSYSIIHADTIAYSENWHSDLKDSIHLNKDQLKDLDISYTRLLAKTIATFIDTHAITDIDAVCSHGHTVLHQPENALTYQIGNRPELATMIGQKVVCDFRVQDVKFGGQGAPLVPIGDRLLFSDYKYCLNLGGFANVSFENNTERSAFDVCPVNIVMNHYCQLVDLSYDDKGNLASRGNINHTLLQDLDNVPFYTQKPPKSLGLEWVKGTIVPLIDSYQLTTNDILRTFVEHIAIQIGHILKDHGNVLVTGGGVFNDFLISRIKELSEGEIVIPSKEIIEYKEALIFGLLGVLRLRDEVNCLSSVTGASRDHSSGKIFMP